MLSTLRTKRAMMIAGAAAAALILGLAGVQAYSDGSKSQKPCDEACQQEQAKWDECVRKNGEEACKTLWSQWKEREKQKWDECVRKNGEAYCKELWSKHHGKKA